MGKIIASFLLKLHIHAPDGEDDAEPIAESEGLTNDRLKEAVIAGVQKELSVDSVTVSLVERTDD